MMARTGTGITLAAATCFLLAPVGAQTPPPRPLIGTFADDYGSAHTVTPGEWIHHPRLRYRITRWDTAGRYILARVNPSGSDSLGAWVRIDWTTFDGMPPWRWGFCLATWDAPTMTAALEAPQSDRENPRTGCNRFPFTRLAPWSTRETATRGGQPQYQ